MPGKAKSKKETRSSLPAQQATKGNLRVVVLHSRCIGAEVCVKEAAGSFVLNKDKKALVANLDANKEDVIINAARNCPTQAIYIYKDNKQVWPPPGENGLAKQPGRDLKMNFEPN